MEMSRTARAVQKARRTLATPHVMDGYLGSHQADPVRPGEDIMNLFYPFVFQPPLTVSRWATAKDATITQILFLPNLFSLYRILCTLCGMWMCPSILPVLFSFLLNFSGFSSYTILRTLYTSSRRDTGL